MTNFTISSIYLFGWIGYCIPSRPDEPLWTKIWAGMVWPLIGAMLIGAYVSRQRKI